MKLRIPAVSLLALFLVSSAVAYQDESFGAIAYSKRSQHYGYATGKHSRRAAEERELELCDRRDCKVEVWFKNNCAALATGSEGQIVGWAYNDRESRARDRALDECRDRNGHRCHIVVAACSH